MARRKVKAAELATVLSTILDKYQEGVIASVDDATKKVAQAGAKELRQVSTSTFGKSSREKPYASGWGATETGNRLSPEYTIWNKTNPGLVHLLEYGHALRAGGRTVGTVRALEHVAPVSDKLEATFEKGVLDAIRSNS